MWCESFVNEATQRSFQHVPQISDFVKYMMSVLSPVLYAVDHPTPPLPQPSGLA